MIDSREYQEEEKENECGYCGEPCEKEFCNRECGKAYDQDNCDEWERFNRNLRANESRFCKRQRTNSHRYILSHTESKTRAKKGKNKH